MPVVSFSDLNDAIAELKDLASKGGYEAGMEELIAGDYENLKPELLMRKFQEKYGKHPSEFKQIDGKAQDVALAKKAAIEASKRFTYPTEQAKECIGVEFENQGDTFYAVAVTKEGIRAVKLGDHAHGHGLWTISWSGKHGKGFEKMLKFVNNHIMKV